MHNLLTGITRHTLNNFGVNTILINACNRTCRVELVSLSLGGCGRRWALGDRKLMCTGRPEAYVRALGETS